MKTDHIHQMLHAPLLPLLLRMATPSAVAFFLQSLVSIAEVAFASRLGTEPLVALALIFPGLMFMQMLSNGAIGGAVASSVARALGAVYRGTGDIKTPSAVMAVGAIVQVPLSGALILGWFKLPAMGLQGSVIALMIVSLLSSVFLLVRLLRQHTVLRPRLATARLQLGVFADIFRVGALASLSPILTVAIVFFTNVLVGGFGASALAGYGIVARVEFLLIPLVFGIGAALTALVGVNMGAGQRRRAVRIAWLGGCVAASLTGAVGLDFGLRDLFACLSAAMVAYGLVTMSSLPSMRVGRNYGGEFFTRWVEASWWTNLRQRAVPLWMTPAFALSIQKWRGITCAVPENRAIDQRSHAGK